MRGFLDAPDILMGDRDENALQALEPADFPITLYDRPGLAMANLLLRGNVDAATRSIFAPQTLTPAEMKSFTDTLLGPKGKQNKLLKTIVDIGTNPFVIMGIVLSLKYPVPGGADRMFRIWSGLEKGIGAPGLLASKFHGAMENLRNIPGAFRAYAAHTKAVGEFVYKYGEAHNEIWNKFGRRPTEKENLMVSAWLQGFNKQHVEKVADHGTKMFIHSALGLSRDKALWPGLEKQMGPGLVKVAKNLRGLSDNIWKEVMPTDAPGIQQLKKEMMAKGHIIGDYVPDWFPILGRYSRLEGPALAQVMQTQKGYRYGLTKAMNYASGHLKKVQGVTVGDIAQLRKMEEYGMPKIVDRMMEAVGKNTRKMEGIVGRAYETVRRVSNDNLRTKLFTDEMTYQLKEAGLYNKVRLGSGPVAETALGNAMAQLDSAFLKNPQAATSKISEIAQVLTEPMQYDMNPIRAFQRYISSVGSSYSWHILKATNPLNEKEVFTGFGGLINRLTKGARLGSWQDIYINDYLNPLVRGLKPHGAYTRGVMMGNAKSQMLTWLNNHPVAQKFIPEGSKDWLRKYFSDFSSLSSESIGAKISEYFYVSTLGLNISPASKNLLQNYITMIHIPGISMRGISAGMQDLMARTATYKGLKSTMPAEKAFHEAFKDFVGAMGKAPGMTHPIASGAMAEGGIGATTPDAIRSIAGKARDISLKGFSATETFNRLFGFYAAKHSFLLTPGADKAMADTFGMMVNNAAHFPGGPLGMPGGLLGVWSPARQFMHFPMRYMGFLRASMDWGKGVSRLTVPMRAAGASAGAYIAAKNLLGADISSGLMYGALPFPQYEDAPFHPWPLVSPMLQVGGAMAKSVSTGDPDQAKRTLALLAPGGIAIRRLYKTLGPKYADYNNKTEDGRIPVYNDSRALIGAYTPWQLTMRALGVAPSSQQAEYDAAKWLLTQREKVRGYRREYLERLADNDVRGAEKINLDFQKAYPELGPLQTQKSDLKAIHNRREISRLNRILKGFPREYQPLFGSMVSQAGLAEITQNLEHRPLDLDAYNPLLLK